MLYQNSIVICYLILSCTHIFVKARVFNNFPAQYAENSQIPEISNFPEANSIQENPTTYGTRPTLKIPFQMIVTPDSKSLQFYNPMLAYREATQSNEPRVIVYNSELRDLEKFYQQPLFD
ncbi:uncharacterized protein CELE_C17F4.12 [Caenorhabditis elegans]|uniref:Uncharacterized protein n=1 Tax=Caenorhabditis elegans TaxID=6239 RepID=Q4W523_CAEEL|nr:Uncharacterized protein CELE_C17F4.12 [Caenorhabditis elegans]CCD64915.1 Uncharacterized protein CELE_C17F4.12 [Caenorhabditis elegans]|eukprot:NP_001021967.1 Uncharacterized protein CELE_C17F4.12 [Caenorhabditis elegans]